MKAKEDMQVEGAKTDAKRSRRSVTQRELHRTLISNELLRGRSQRAIAAALNLSQATVARDVAALRREWRESRLRNVDELVAEGVAVLTFLRNEALAGYEVSKAPVTKRSSKSRGFAPVPRKVGEKVVPSNLLLIEQTLKEETRVPDPRFLETAGKVEVARCKLLGLFDAEPSGEQTPERDFESPRQKLLHRIREASENLQRSLPAGIRSDGEMRNVKNVTPRDALPKALKEGSDQFSHDFTGETGPIESDELDGLVIKRA